MLTGYLSQTETLNSTRRIAGKNREEIIMRFLVPTTIEGVRKQKQRFMFRWVTETNPKQKEVYERAVNGCDRLTAHIIEKGKRKLGLMLIMLCLSLMTGCTASIGGGASASAFYPKKWESPASRKQHTQPTLGMARNNLPMVGGAK